MLAALGIIIFHSCDNKKLRTDNPPLNAGPRLISRAGFNQSHVFGSTCSSCHSPNGASMYIFNVMGSVSNEARTDIQSRSIIKLYTRPRAKGRLVATISSDDLGNFYSTENIDFSLGLFPTLSGTPGVKEDTKHMSRPIFSGDCNSCHGRTAEKLGID